MPKSRKSNKELLTDERDDERDERDERVEERMKETDDSTWWTHRRRHRYC